MECMTIDGKKYLTGRQIAEQRNVTHSTVNRWIGEGLFPNARKLAFTSRGMWIVPLTDYEGATFPAIGSQRLVKAGKASRHFVERMTKLLKASSVGDVHTVRYKVIKESTAKWHLRAIARKLSITIRFNPSEVANQLTFRIKAKEGGKSGTPSTNVTASVSAGVDGPAAVDGAD